MTPPVDRRAAIDAQRVRTAEGTIIWAFEALIDSREIDAGCSGI
jgi:hypothetical protein